MEFAKPRVNVHAMQDFREPFVIALIVVMLDFVLHQKERENAMDLINAIALMDGEVSTVQVPFVTLDV